LVMSAGSDDVDAAMKCTTGLRSPEVNWPDLCDPSVQQTQLIQGQRYIVQIIQYS
jgi:hypothetical protein